MLKEQTVTKQRFWQQSEINRSSWDLTVKKNFAGRFLFWETWNFTAMFSHLWSRNHYNLQIQWSSLQLFRQSFVCYFVISAFLTWRVLYFLQLERKQMNKHWFFSSPVIDSVSSFDFHLHFFNFFFLIFS